MGEESSTKGCDAYDSTITTSSCTSCSSGRYSQRSPVEQNYEGDLTSNDIFRKHKVSRSTTWMEPRHSNIDSKSCGRITPCSVPTYNGVTCDCNLERIQDVDEMGYTISTTTKPSSHGNRPGFQAGEVHVGLRCLFSTCQEWQFPLVVAKIDIAKAYDTMSWNAIQR